MQKILKIIITIYTNDMETDIIDTIKKEGAICYEGEYTKESIGYYRCFYDHDANSSNGWRRKASYRTGFSERFENRIGKALENQ